MYTVWKRKQEQAGKNLLKMHIESEHMGLAHTCEMYRNTYKTKDTFRKHVIEGACKVKSLATTDPSTSHP